MMQQDTGEYDELGDLDGFVFEDGGASADAGGSNPFAAEVEERARAATTLQAAQRGRRERKAVRDRHDAAVRIQAAHRGRASRRGSAVGTGAGARGDNKAKRTRKSRRGSTQRENQNVEQETAAARFKLSTEEGETEGSSRA